MVLGCHNVIYYNHSTLVLGYLLLFGYDASGSAYTMRLFAMLFGFILTGVVFWRNHRKKTYKRGLRDLFNEFNLHSSRSRWQLLMASAVSSVIFYRLDLKSSKSDVGRNRRNVRPASVSNRY